MQHVDFALCAAWEPGPPFSPLDLVESKVSVSVGSGGDSGQACLLHVRLELFYCPEQSGIGGLLIFRARIAQTAVPTVQVSLQPATMFNSSRSTSLH